MFQNWWKGSHHGHASDFDMFSTCLEIFDTFSTWFITFQNCTFHIFHTFNARSGLTVYTMFWMSSVTIWVQMFQIFKFKMYWKHVEKLSWKFQQMLKTVMHAEKCIEIAIYHQILCIIVLNKVKTNIINKGNRLIWCQICTFHNMHNTYCVETVCINHIENHISRHVENVLKISRCVENHVENFKVCWKCVDNFKACWKPCWKFQGMFYNEKKPEKTPLCFDFVVGIYTIFCTNTSYEHFQNIMLNST